MRETIPRAANLAHASADGADTVARTDAACGDASGSEPALADRLFELVARFRRPRPIGPRQDDAHEEQHRQRHGQMRMLLALGHAGPLTVQDLARVLEVSAPSASVLAKKAFEEGFVARRRDAHDSRMVWLDLAEAGREHLRAHRQDRIRRLDQLIDAHPELDRADIARAVDVMLQLFDRDTRAAVVQPDGDTASSQHVAGRTNNEMGEE